MLFNGNGHYYAHINEGEVGGRGGVTSHPGGRRSANEIGDKRRTDGPIGLTTDSTLYLIPYSVMSFAIHLVKTTNRWWELID